MTKSNERNQSGFVNGGQIREVVNQGSKNINTYKQMGKKLSKINTNRGGRNLKGFLFEEMHAADATVRNTSGKISTVLNNNGPVDLKISSGVGRPRYAQLKTGYKTTKAGFQKSPCKNIIVDKGNTKLIKEAKNAGKNVIESNITDAQAKGLANAMKFESKITGSSTAPITSKIVSTANMANQAHKVGVIGGLKSSQFGGGFSFGSNAVEVMTGDKKFGEAVGDVAKDTVVAGVVGYGVTTAGAVLASTSVGIVASSAIATGTAAATAAIGSTAVGASALAAAGTVGAGVATAGAVVSAGTAVVLGTAVAGTAIGAATVAATPVVLGAAAVGATFTGISKLFR